MEATAGGGDTGRDSRFWKPPFCLEPSPTLSLIVDALAAAKIEHLEKDGIKALRLKAARCSCTGSVHMVKLQTNYNFSKVSRVEVDAENTQMIDNIYLVPVVLHVMQSALKILFVYFTSNLQDIAACSKWSLGNSNEVFANFDTELGNSLPSELSTSAARSEPAPEVATEGKEGKAETAIDNETQQTENVQDAMASTNKGDTDSKVSKAARKKLARSRKLAASSSMRARRGGGKLRCKGSEGIDHKEITEDDSSSETDSAGEQQCQQSSLDIKDDESGSDSCSNASHKSPTASSSDVFEDSRIAEVKRSKSAPSLSESGPHTRESMQSSRTDLSSSAGEPDVGPANFSPVVGEISGCSASTSVPQWPRTWSPWMSTVDAWLFDAAPAAKLVEEEFVRREDATTAADARSLVRSLTEETPDRFGDGELSFVIHELLGQGGFGSVYRCSLVAPWSQHVKQQSLLQAGQEFAVKVIDAQRIALLSGTSTEAVVPRLLREADIHQLLGQHPHIVTLHCAFYSHASAKLYLIYELLRGGDLFAAIVRQRKPFNEPEARHLFRQLAEALLFGHKQGIAHRDVKLDNCLLKDIGTLSVKLCDYGQAKMIGEERAPARTVTAPRHTQPLM